ncbi:hypothetical protein Dsin_005972 [Dipteronia sinensis]|uniref:Uncharacterized protein n=1 Tax=Dipteronia sinensis TaxID=43782 RepID=A0AAE0AYL1_9ROSI|nr:hypothetical protein Dsin_005972 [Dipteronia sinensis]
MVSGVIKRVLDVYKMGSGQQVNVQKSCITFSPSTSEVLRVQIMGLVELEKVQAFDKHLGHPTLVGKNKIKTFNELKEKGSEEGEKKISWVKWETLYLPKSLGGLGLMDLGLFNQALVAKQALRLAVGECSLVAQVMKAKYFRNEEFLSVRLKPGNSHVWRSLV